MEPAPDPGPSASDLAAALRGVPDADLALLVKALAGSERAATAALLAHLGELDARELHLRAGFGSLFTYCLEALRLSEGDAFNRIEVARAARRFPAILALLEEGALNLVTVRLLARYLTAENHLEVLGAARGKRRAQVEEIVARLFPVPDVPLSLRKLPPPRPGPNGVAPPPDPAVTFSRPLGASSPGGRPPASVVPLSPERYRLQVTIGGETLERLRLARDLLRHVIPSGDDAAVLDRALVSLLADLARKKFAATDNPRPGRGTAEGSRHVAAEVRRAVFLRDLGRCAFVAPDGRRCGERAFLEFHHLRPWAEGGAATAENIQLRCRRHNAHEARVHQGPRGPLAGRAALADAEGT
jgi:hypothetical protein